MKKFTTVSALALLAACGGAPESFAEIDPAVTEFNSGGPNLNFTVELDLVTENSGPTQLGMVIGEIADGVQAGLPGLTAETKHAQIQVHISSIDGLGNKGFSDIGTVRLPVDLLRKANADNMTPNMWLDLVDQINVAEAPMFASAMVRPCTEGSFYSAGTGWCAKAAEALD